ncbi:MAG: efflux RND transporter permease subunit [Caulobacteraceae bacterium]
MSISSPFIKRPVATSLIAVAFLVVGVICYFQLPVAALPDVDVPTLQISANLPGGSPETMALQRGHAPGAAVLADPWGRRDDLHQRLRQHQHHAAVRLERNIDAAAQDVQSRHQRGRRPAAHQPAQPAGGAQGEPHHPAVFGIDMMSPTLPLATVSDYADSIVAQQLSRLEGVGQVLIGGVRKPAIRIRIDPRKAAALGLQLDAIRAAIAGNTINAPKGQFTGPRQAMTIYANDQVQDPKVWDQLIVGYSHGAPFGSGTWAARSWTWRTPSRAATPCPARPRTRGTRPCRPVPRSSS